MWHTNSKEENEILYTRFLEKNTDFSDSMINVTGTKCDVLRMKRLEISLVNVIAHGAWHKAKRLVMQCINGVSSNPVEGRTKI